MCNKDTSIQCKVLVQTIQDEVFRIQDIIFQTQCLEASASGFVAMANVALNHGVQSLAAAADHLQHAANDSDPR